MCQCPTVKEKRKTSLFASLENNGASKARRRRPGQSNRVLNSPTRMG